MGVKKKRVKWEKGVKRNWKFHVILIWPFLEIIIIKAAEHVEIEF